QELRERFDPADELDTQRIQCCVAGGPRFETSFSTELAPNASSRYAKAAVHAISLALACRLLSKVKFRGTAVVHRQRCRSQLSAAADVELENSNSRNQSGRAFRG
ncbi:hypothetical protein QTH97_35575, partial [Variovorax sp. J22R24]|uniref:hypothetical protein n=1 Tax=Variovorax gracilis TaxID=3053502 RepID=UPI002574A20D